MAKPEREDEAVRAYRRILGEVAQNQVVAAAEEILGEAWIDELERFRTAVLDVAGSGSVAELAARQEVDTPWRRIGPDEAFRVLEALDEELEHVCAVGIERSRRGREDLARLRAAWAAAYERPDGRERRED